MLKAFRGQQFEHTHENKVFDELYDILAIRCSATQQNWALFGNFHVGNRELDALLIKQNALVVIDFKNFAGKLDISEDGPWFIENATDGQRINVKGGASVNPLVQLKYNRRALAGFMENMSQQCNWGHIAATVLFHGAIKFDAQQIPGNCKPWLHITDMNGIIRTLEAIVSREIYITPNDVQYIVNRLGLSPFVPASANILDTRLLSETSTTVLREEKQPTFLQKQTLAAFSGWLYNPIGIFRLLGMVSTGKRFLFPFLISLIEQGGFTPLLLAPGVRFIGNYQCHKIQQYSVYTWLYNLTPTHFENSSKGYKVAVHDVRGDIVLTNVMPILVDAHLLSDEEFKPSNRRYGSGRLISDFLNVIGGTPFVVIGDPYQILRGSQGSSIAAITPPNYIKVAVKTHELPELILKSPNNAVNSLQVHLRDSINRGAFNHLPEFLGDGLDIIEKHSKQQWTPDTENLIPTSMYLCGTHEQVNLINAAVKKRLLSHSNPVRLGEGDRIDFHSRTAIIQSKDTYDTNIDIQWVNSGSIGIVDKIIGPIETEKVSLAGRSLPIIIRMQKISCRVVGLGEVEIRYLVDFYEAEKPEISIDYEIALMVLARWRAAPLLNKDKELLPKDKKDSRYIEAKKKYDLLEHQVLQQQGIVTAARIRPAFALTVHRAQGRHWPCIWLNASGAVANDSYVNQGYYRWLYTATTCAGKLFIQNFPKINPMINATVKRAPNINVGFISIKTSLQYDKQRTYAEQNASIVPPAGFSNVDLIPLLLELQDRLKDFQWRMIQWQEYPYQVLITLSSDVSDTEVKVRLNYDAALSITNVTFPDTQSKECEEVKSLLLRPFIPESQALAEALSGFLVKLTPRGFQLLGAKESNYKISGTLAKGKEAVEFDLYANKEGMVSSINLLKATTDQILAEVELALGVEK